MTDQGENRDKENDKNRDVSVEKIPEDVRENVPPEDLERIIQIARYEESYQGPIPPPAVIGQYEQVLPGSADRIISMAEKQLEHRHKMESSVIQADIRREYHGLIAASLLAALFGIGSILLILNGYSVVGLSIIIGELVSLVGVFVYTQSQRQKERVEKQRNLEQSKRPLFPDKSDSE